MKDTKVCFTLSLTFKRSNFSFDLFLFPLSLFSCFLLFLDTKCRNLPFGGRAMRGLTGASSMEGRCAESPPMFIRGKRRKNRKGVIYEL